MSKEASVIQKYNVKKREYEYFVKGYDITESIKNLLKLHKEAYDKENHSILEMKGFIEAQNIYLPQIKDLEHRLSNCIEPKYKAGQEVWHLLCENGVAKDVIEENYNVYSLKISRLGGLYEDLLFATEAEAKAKLEELNNGR